MNKKKVIGLILLLLVVSSGLFVYNNQIRPTKIALVHYQDNAVAGMAKAAENSFIEIKHIDIEELEKIKNFDFILISGMGLRIDEDQRNFINEIAQSGKPLYVSSATNPENKINSLNEEQTQEVEAYLSNGGKDNYKELFNYIRRNIDRKTLFSHPIVKAFSINKEVFFYPNQKQTFSDFSQYEKFGTEKGYLKENRPKIAVLSGISSPFDGNSEQIDALFESLNKKDLNVYLFAGTKNRLEMLEQIQPDAVVYFPHGRVLMADSEQTVQWLQKRNIPLFTPLSVQLEYNKWMGNKQGMTGGFMNQTVVIPELDGAKMPYVYFAPQQDKDGLYPYKVIPERLTTFVESIEKHIRLKRADNADKKIAVYYFKGPGNQSLVAANMEVVPSLYNLLLRLKSEGYTIKNLPDNLDSFTKLIANQGSIFEPYAKGEINNYLQNGNPELIQKEVYEKWCSEQLPEKLYDNVVETYGEAPGDYFTVHKDNKDYIAVSRIDLGNVVLLAQPLSGLGDDTFALVHGSSDTPPHTYIASYLWVQKGFQADALIHFGTHGSLEFINGKAVALSSQDWPDRLTGNLPHYYVYTIANVGEAMMTKRRTYATTITHLTQPFLETQTRGEYKMLLDKMKQYHTGNNSEKTAKEIKDITLKMGIHRDLRLDSLSSIPYTSDQIEAIERFAEEIASSKMTGSLYVMGEPYPPEKNESTVVAMATDPLAFSLAFLDKQKGKISDKQLYNNVFFNQQYKYPSQTLVQNILKGKTQVDEELIRSVSGISTTDLANAKAFKAANSVKMPSLPFRKPDSGKKPEPAKEYTEDEKAFYEAVLQVEHTLNNILLYKKYLEESPKRELDALVNALNGGYTLPSPGGDPVANPNTLPTGRNLYAVNVEATPTVEAWDKGVKLAKDFIEDYQKRNKGEFPKRVNMTLWSSSFIETNGAPFAQILYLLGVEPVRDAFDRVTELRLIPSEQLGRPRVDVVVQTSGQLRDLAASRLFLVNKAISMAAQAEDIAFENNISNETRIAEKTLIEKGFSPVEAKKLSKNRIFGGINGNYSAGITSLVQKSDKWTSESQVAETYINNMGASYNDEKDWGNHYKEVLEVMLNNTDAVIHNRQSNTWGPLSLDHVYEFMGGINLAIHHVSGKDPDAYFSDYRNRHQPKIQELKESIGIESRTTIFNPAYIKEQMKGSAGNAAMFEETFKNIFGWSVMKNEVIDQQMWNRMYDIYIEDRYNLGIVDYFESENPYALEEMTAVMLESARKGFWKPTKQQLQTTANIHVDLVARYGLSGTGKTTENKLLHQEIIKNISAESAEQYKQQIALTTTGSSQINGDKTVVLQKDQQAQSSNRQTGSSSAEKPIYQWWILSGVAVVLFVVVLVRRKNKK